MIKQQAEAAPTQRRPIQRHWVGVDMWLEHLSDGTTIWCQLFRKGDDGSPEPLLREPLVVMDFDPNRIRAAFKRGQDAAMAALGVEPFPQRKRTSSRPKEKEPLTHHLERGTMEKALMQSKKQPRHRRRRRHNKQQTSLTYWCRRFAAVWDRW